MVLKSIVEFMIKIKMGKIPTRIQPELPLQKLEKFKSKSAPLDWNLHMKVLADI